ncbi:MAG: hypothetical protein RIB03_12410 [Henriciella sp.]
MKKSMLALLFAIGAAGTGTLAACDANDGPVEEAGEEVDEAADEVEEEVD